MTTSIDVEGIHFHTREDLLCFVGTLLGHLFLDDLIAKNIDPDDTEAGVNAHMIIMDEVLDEALDHFVRG